MYVSEKNSFLNINRLHPKGTYYFLNTFYVYNVSIYESVFQLKLFPKVVNKYCKLLNCLTFQLVYILSFKYEVFQARSTFMFRKYIECILTLIYNELKTWCLTKSNLQVIGLECNIYLGTKRQLVSFVFRFVNRQGFL